MYKSKDVHKRRAVGKERAPEGGSADVRQSDSQALDEAAPRAELPADSHTEPDSPDLVAGDSEASADQGPSEGEGAGSHGKKGAKKRRIRVRTVLVAFLLVILIAIIGLCAAFAWDRWGRYDDHADMQGQWYVLGTTAPVTIDEGEIHLTDEVSYEYEIDEHSKTISYTFGPMQGQGRYWFSGDRRFFAIIDGEGYTGATTALEDVVRFFTAASGATGAKLPTGEGVVVFGREPGWFAAITQEAAARAKERVNAQKAQEKAEAEAKAAEAKAKAEKEREEAAKKSEEAAKAAEAEEAEAYDSQYAVDEQQEYLYEEEVEGEDAEPAADEADEDAEPSDDAETPADAASDDDAEAAQEADDAETL